MHNFHDLKGEQQDQLLVVVDKHGKKPGLATREKCHSGGGITHLAFIAFLFDKKGNLILTKRSRRKSLWAGFWDAAAISHVLPGETPEKAADRRGKEELGIKVNFKIIGSFYYFAKHEENCENEYLYVLAGKTDQQIIPNPIEIDEVKSLSLENLKLSVKTYPDKYTPWLLLSLTKINAFQHLHPPKFF